MVMMKMRDLSNHSIVRLNSRVITAMVDSYDDVDDGDGPTWTVMHAVVDFLVVEIAFVVVCDEMVLRSYPNTLGLKGARHQRAYHRRHPPEHRSCSRPKRTNFHGTWASHSA